MLRPEVARLLSRRARNTLSAMLHVADEGGRVLADRPALAAMLGVSGPRVSGAISDLLDADILERRFLGGGRTAPRVEWRIRLECLFRHPGFGACESCGRPTAVVDKPRTGGRWCPRCRQKVGRRDMAWKDLAVAMALEGASVWKIHAATGAPLTGHGPRPLRDEHDTIAGVLVAHNLLADDVVATLEKIKRGQRAAPAELPALAS